MIVANLLALAAPAQLPARVVLGFADEEVEALLGLDDPRREFPLCFVAIGDGDEVQPAGAPADPVSFDVMRLSATEYVFQAIGIVNDAGRLSASRVEPWRSGLKSQRRDSGSRGDLPPDAPADSAQEVIMRRGSSRRFGRKPVPREVLSTILDVSTRGIPTDYAPEGGSRLVEPYLIANAVDGLPAGAYAWRDGGLVPLEEGDFRKEAAYLCLEQRLGATAAATHFLMIDLERVLGAAGDRGYRAAQLEAGIVAGKMYLGAYAHRFGATGLTFYDDDVTAFLSPGARGKSCMLVVAIGESTRRP